MQVHDDDTRFRQLVADAEAVRLASRAEWKKLHIERDLLQEHRFHAGLATLFLTLPAPERSRLLDWLAAHPLPNPDHQLVARVTLGDAAAVPEVLLLLREAAAPRLRNLLWALSWFDWPSVPALFDRRREVLLPLLDHPDGLVVTRLTMVLGRMERELWAEAVRARLVDRDYAHKGALVGLLKGSRSLDTVELLAKAMRARRPDEPPERILYALLAMADREDDIGRAAAEAVFATVEAGRPEEMGPVFAGLFGQDAERALPLAERYLLHVTKQPDAEAWPASYVLRAWARRRGPGREELIRTWVDHPTLGRSALEALTEIGAGSGDPALVELWLRHAEASKNPHVHHQIATIGGEVGRKAVLDLVATNHGGRDVGLLWRLEGVTLDDALRACVEHGLLAEVPAPDTMRTVVDAEDPLTSPFHRWMSVIAATGRAARFDTETGTFPNRHDELIVDTIAKGSGGLFRPTRAIEVWRDATQDYEVAFEHAGRFYHFRAEGLGDWYDVRSLLAAVNGALDDAGHPERFHAIDTGGQDAFLVIATPETITALAARLHLPLDTDPDRARKLGRAFEELATKRLQ